MIHNVRSHFYQTLIKAAQRCKTHYDPETGRFMQHPVMIDGRRTVPSDGTGWALTLQDPVLAFAYLYKTPGENNPFYKDPETFDLICGAIKAWRDWQYPDGRMEFIKVNGETWGPIYMPWSWYHWLETYILMKDELPEAVRLDWENGLLPGLESYAKQDPERVHNIPVWQAMTVHRAGKVFDRPDWCDAADVLMENACRAQNPDGFWAEYDGPTVGYNMVYTHGLGLYHIHGGKVNVMPAIHKATAFLQASTYPSGAYVDTHEGRRRYHGTDLGPLSPLSNMVGMPAFLLTEGGMEYLSRHLEHFTNGNATMPHIATFLIALDNFTGFTVDEFKGIGGCNHSDFTAIHGKLSVIRKNNNQISLSAYTAPLNRERWAMDRQSFASVWTEDADLLMGSGNSKAQIECSSFIICGENGEVLSAMPTSGQVEPDGSITLEYDGKAVCRIRGEIADNGIMTLRYSAQLKDSGCRWRISLPLRPGLTEEDAPYTVCVRDGSTRISFRGWTVSVRDDCRILCPVRPLNPYVRNGGCDPEDQLLTAMVYPKGEEIAVTFAPEEKMFFDEGSALTADYTAE